jgi:hypothetical protein
MDTLQGYPRLTASRLFAMVQKRGYPDVNGADESMRKKQAKT